MVKIALAGGNGQVGREVLDALLVTKKHECVVLSRKNPGADAQTSGVTYLTVDYNNASCLIKALQGVDTVLCFIVSHMDPESTSQKNLIDAAIAAGVRRFAPSEWAGSTLVDMPMHIAKVVVRDYLSRINETNMVLEYTLFQPGIFLDYLAAPYQTAKHVLPLQTMFDYQNRRAYAIDGHDPIFTFTAVQDLAQIVARAVEYEGKWPVVGGVSGNKIAISDIIRLGEEVRGASFTVDHVKVEDLEAGTLELPTLPTRGRHSMSLEETSKLMRQAYVGILLGSTRGAWDVGTEWNELFPNHEFAKMESFLDKIWRDKP